VSSSLGSSPDQLGQAWADDWLTRHGPGRDQRVLLADHLAQFVASDVVQVHSVAGPRLELLDKVRHRALSSASILIIRINNCKVDIAAGRRFLRRDRTEETDREFSFCVSNVGLEIEMASNLSHERFPSCQDRGQRFKEKVFSIERVQSGVVLARDGEESNRGEPSERQPYPMPDTDVVPSVRSTSSGRELGPPVEPE
jgi:hypothetical protein